MKNALWSGDPNISVSLNEIKTLLECLEKNGCDVKACKDWLHDAEATFQLRFFGFLPYGRYDKIWATLNQLRHAFCRILPPEHLLAVLVKIRGYIPYVEKDEQRKEYGKELDGVEEALQILAAGHGKGKASTLSVDEMRFILERISRLTADAREAHWRKVNLLRTRLLTTAVILAGLLFSGIWLIPLFSSNSGITSPKILAVILSGAVGGLVSALRTTESLEASASAYYIQRTLLGLRPVIGATAGMLLYLMQLSGLVSLIPSGVNSEAAYLVLAFVAGFSERFFIAQIERFVSADHGSRTEKMRRQKENER